MKIYATLLIAIILFLSMPHAANAAEGWQIVINASRLDRYFDYPTTSLRSIIKLSVGYQLDDSAGFTPYETLYYNGSLPIGCTKLSRLSLSSTAGGTIKIAVNSDNPIDSDECDAFADAAGRLFLDLYLKKLPVYDIIVPEASFDGVIASFKRMGFYESDPSNSPQLVLSVVSDPPGRCQAMAF